MKKCEVCKKQRIYSEIIITSIIIKECCPVCALNIRNKIHGMPRGTPFTGDIANQHYVEELELANEKRD